ncbi:MAG: type III-B CRISPR-associated protein Cas10/Cmr2 [Bacteroidetes bacterium]|nr:type III-B CRISPR-associated protein Cas10/Cmr2 [Bacteroidota bacterium]
MDNAQERVICKTDWEHVLGAWMHDPFDKALSIRDHQSRALRHVQTALGKDHTISNVESTSKSADLIASIADRIPMPTAGYDGERAVNTSNGSLTIFHPVSAQPDEINVSEISSFQVSDAISSIVDQLPEDADAHLRFLALWRLLPSQLYDKFGLNYIRLPADTRVPDHTLIQHADITSGIKAASQFGCGYAILSVSLGPVQAFIQASRSLRDLWSGSTILSWLIFQGILPVLQNLGPTVMVYPALRGNSLVDLWLRRYSGLEKLIDLPSRVSRQSPSLPNRFVALIPYGKDGKIASDFETACREAISCAWQSLSNQVYGKLNQTFSQLDPDWGIHWESQVNNYFDVTTSICPINDLDDSMMASLIGGQSNFGNVWDHAQKIREMHDVIPYQEKPRFKQDKAGQWQAQMEVSARIAEANRSIRHIPQISPIFPSGPKCSLFGTYEQMGPANLDASATFWSEASKAHDHHIDKIRKKDRFCAIALCKRFAPSMFLQYQLNLKQSDLPYPDTATIAAIEWLQKYLNSFKNWHSWNGQWLHQRQQTEDDEKIPDTYWKEIRNAKRSDGSPPSYYAILVMDADNMGLWLKGEHAPKVKEILHPKLRKYYENLNTEGIQVKRPVGPALHGAISEALNNFATHSVPNIVHRHQGTLIYSGGDDVLALLPARCALQCAMDLYEAFQGGNGDIRGWTQVQQRYSLAMGDKATLSAGIAYVHYKEDLRAALQAARDAEKESKSNGKNRVTLRFMRRSGEHSRCDLSWKLANWFEDISNAFSSGLSDRWLYQLRRESSVLSHLPSNAVNAEIKRLINRSQAMEDVKASSEVTSIDQWWPHYRLHTKDSNSQLGNFIQLCLGAAFIARGVDGR